MNALERLRAGLFSDSPKCAKPENRQQREAIASLRCDANELADEIEAEQTAKRRVVGDTTKHCVCLNCEQGVDPWDVYCRWCGKELVDE